MLHFSCHFDAFPIDKTHENLKPDKQVRIDIVEHIYLLERLNVPNVEAGMVQKYGTQIANTAVPFGSATINLVEMRNAPLPTLMRKPSKRHL